jgi:hypothetical protein
MPLFVPRIAGQRAKSVEGDDNAGGMKTYELTEREI